MIRLKVSSTGDARPVRERCYAVLVSLGIANFTENGIEVLIRPHREAAQCNPSCSGKWSLNGIVEMCPTSPPRQVVHVDHSAAARLVRLTVRPTPRK